MAFVNPRNLDVYTTYFATNSISETAKKFGISIQRVTQILKKMDKSDLRTVTIELQEINMNLLKMTNILQTLTKVLNELNWETLVLTLKEVQNGS